MHLLQLKTFPQKLCKKCKTTLQKGGEVYISLLPVKYIQVTESHLPTNVLANEKNLYLKSLCYADAVQPTVFHVLRNVCNFFIISKMHTIYF